MQIAVVILNWNGKKLLQNFLPDIVRYSPTEISTIYLVDNASTDDSVAYVRQNFSTVIIIENTENGGYAKGYNEALKRIDAEILALVNSDIEVTENWLEPVYQHFKNNPTTAIAQPKILDYKKKTHFEYAGAAGGFIDQLGYPYCRGRIFNTLEPDALQYNTETEIFWASGACFFIRSEVFWQLNGMDESYFAHQEEIDLCWRAFNAHHTTMYLPQAVVYHVGGASLSHSHWRKTFLNFRNSLFNILKNAPQPIVPLIFKRLILDGIAGLKFLTEGKILHTLAILKAHFSFYINLSKMLKNRKIQPVKRQDYYATKSILWEYYFRNRKHFNELD